MSKDMINIDDFVREKLNGHSEKNDPKAWLKMKELLDKEKPEKVAPFMFRFSKPMALVGAALLVGALCVGGYKLSALRELNNNNNNTITNTNQTSNTAPNNTRYQSPIENKTKEINNKENDTKENIENKALENSLATNTNSNNKTTNFNKQDDTKSSKIEDKTLELNNNEQVKPLENNKQQNIAAQNNKEQSKEQKATAQQKKNTLIHKKASSNNNLTTAKKENKNAEKVAENKTTENAASQDDIINQKTAQSKATLLKGMSNTLKNKVDNKTLVQRQLEKSNEGNSKINKSNNQKNETVKTNPNSGSNTAANGKQLPKDSMPSITIVKKSNISKTYPKKISQSMDTIAMGKVPVETIPNSKTGNIAKAKTNNQSATSIALNAQSPTKATVENNTELNAKKKKTNKPLLGNINFPEAVAAAKHDLKNADFYFGFSGGLNYSASKNNGFQGVQFGPTGELVFNKHWSLFGAIKYFNRSGSKKIINDNSSKEYYSGSIDSTVGFNNYFTVHTDSVNRYFNFSTVHSFELPLTIRYTINKFYLMTGMNLAYYLSLNVEQVEKAYNNASTHTVSTNLTKPILNEQKSKLSSADFGSRFAIGYVLGAGYQINPAWQADIRVVNTFWDNAKGAGSQSISKDFYRIPSIQISVGYQFGRANSRATFGPTQ